LICRLMSIPESRLHLTEEENQNLVGNEYGTRITTKEAEDRLWDAIQEALESAENSLFSAPTGLGKTHLIATTQWSEYPELTGGEPVIHISQTRDARNDAIEMSEEAGVNYTVLRAREEMCQVARGDFDDDLRADLGEAPSDWFDRKCDTEQISFSVAHQHLRQLLDGLPCIVAGSCPSQRQWRNVPRSNVDEVEYDVIHATAPFARVPDLIDNTNLIFDELPEYQVDFQQEHLRRALNDLLERRADVGNYTWEELIQLATQPINTPYAGTLPPEDPEANQRATEYWELLQEDIDAPLQASSSETVHTLVPAIGRAVLHSIEARNDRYQGTDPEGDLRLAFDVQNTLKIIQNPPSLQSCRCVIGLDAHPSENLWEFNLDIDLERGDLFTTDERQYWRRQERGLHVVQIGNNTSPITRGWRNNRQRTKIRYLIRELRRKADDEFRTVICPKSVEEDVEALLREEGIGEPELLHYGEERSRNDFQGETTGLLIGCIDPGDEEILDLLAVMGYSAEPEMNEGESGEGSRTYGRGFEGPDSDIADEILQSVRETHIAQSIGRYARTPRASDVGAIVYVWTNAIPSGMVDAHVPGLVSRLRGENQLAENKEDIDRFVREHGGPVTKRMVAEEISVSDRYAHDVLNEMAEQGVVTVSEGTGPYGAHEYEHEDGSLGPTVDLDIPADS